MFYSLDAILSVGYRVNSKNATIFRRWANTVLKDYLLRGYAVNRRLDDLLLKIWFIIWAHHLKTSASDSPLFQR